MSIPNELRVVGAPVLRKDAGVKTTGKAIYSADIKRPNMLVAKVLRSPHAHAAIRKLDASKAEAMSGVHAVLTRDTLPDPAARYGYFIKDMPIVAIDRVRYAGDVVAAVAAEDEATAIRALQSIVVEYEPLPVIASMDEALAAGAAELFEAAPMGIIPAYGDGASATLRTRPNVCYEFRYQTGNPAAFDRAAHVFEDEFVFSAMNHFHLEPFVTVAEVVGDQVEIWTSCQNPFPLRKELARILKRPENAIRVHVPFIGGGFGAKNNCKTEPIAILLAEMSGRPVRFALTLEEGFLTMSQHAAVLRLKTGVGADGRFVARTSEILLDAGAYSDASPLVAEKAGYRIPGPYRWDYIDSSCACVMTNRTPAGPFRGFGGTQATWASESQLDMIARRLGFDPYDFRMANLLNAGDSFVPGESGIDSDLRQGLDLVADEIGYAKRSRGGGRGMGLAIGFKDGGGVNKPAQARVKVTTTGAVLLQCGTVEIGQGATTALCQVVAEIMGVPYEKVSYAPVDTDNSPFDQGTNASSGISVMGQAVRRAAEAAREKVLEFAAEVLGQPNEELRLVDWTICVGDQTHPLAPMIMGYYGGTGFEFVGEGYHKAANDHHAPLETQCVFWEIGWGAAEVAVDRETGKVDLLQLIVSGDAGRAINKLICQGQDEGAAMMGLSQALFEHMAWDGATLVNGEALDYRVPLAEDLPPRFLAITQEQGLGPGPFGAKGMGEGAMLPVAAAIANAIEDAVGVRITTLPITPERVLAALDAQATKGNAS